MLMLELEKIKKERAAEAAAKVRIPLSRCPLKALSVLALVFVAFYPISHGMYCFALRVFLTPVFSPSFHSFPFLQEEQEAQSAAQERSEAVLKGNPLIAGAGSASGGGGEFSFKRRWDDDVVFKNQTRTEPETKRRFINDTVRNDFHRRFLQKYVR
jgi:hypothetical protein